MTRSAVLSEAKGSSSRFAGPPSDAAPSSSPTRKSANSPRLAPPKAVEAGPLFGAQIVALYPRLLRYASTLKRCRDDIEDLAQDTVCRALGKGHLYEAGTNLMHWLCRIMLGIHIDELRRVSRRTVHVELTTFNAPAVRPLQETEAAARQAVRAVAKVNPRYRRVVELSLLEKTNEEIAQVLCIPYGTVLSRLCRGRQDLMRHIERAA